MKGKVWDLATKTVPQLQLAATLCIDDHQSKQEDFEVVGELPSVCP